MSLVEELLEVNRILSKVIDTQEKKIGELEGKLEIRQYNRRYTNKKFVTATKGDVVVQDDKRSKK